MSRKALIVIDVQNDFAHREGSLYVPHGESVVDPIISLMQEDSWHCVVLTRDWHPTNHVSFAKNHDMPNFSPFTYVSPIPGKQGDKQDSLLWPVHCVQNTWGADIVDRLMKAFTSLEKPHCLIDKGMLSDREYYSAFSDIWGDNYSELDTFLKEHNISEVFVVGLALDYCVKASAISASKLGYKTTVLRRYTKAIATSEDVLKIEAELSKNRVSVVE